MVEEDKEPSRFGREGNGTQGKEVPSCLCWLTVFSRLASALLRYRKPHL